MGLFIPGFIIPRGGGSLTWTYINANGSASNLATYTFNTINAGDPGDADNYLVFAFYGERDDNNGDFAMSSASLGSNSLSFLGKSQLIGASRRMIVEFWGGYVSGSANQNLSYTWGATIARSMYAYGKIKGSTSVANDTARRQTLSASSGGDYTFSSFTLGSGEVWLSAICWRSASSVMTTSGATEHVENTIESTIRSNLNSNVTPGTVSNSGTSAGSDIVSLGIVLTPGG